MTAACDPCAHAAAHGWWGPDHRGTHCRDCHASWAGYARAHCTVCHETFASAGVAEAHWLRGVHHDPSTVPALRLGDDGTWHTAAERPAHWRAA
jgi:hypothetical protein